jgi:hypothetical protein
MKTQLLVGAILIGLLPTAAFAATSVKSSKSNSSDRVRGRFVTSTTNLSGPSETQTVYTTPAKGQFYLTQVCASPANGGIQLDVTAFGGIAKLGGDSMWCVTFPSPVVIPKNRNITCSTTSFAASERYFCTIFGVENLRQ